jgi:lipoprotein-anchoring transpeptidase ErfK/SrfK
VGTAAALVAGGSAAGIVLATQGPSAAAVRAQKAKVAAEVAASVRAAEERLLSYVKISPKSGMSGVALNAPVLVSTASGALSSVKVLDPSGAALAGSWAPGHTRWVSNGPLKPTTTYRVTATVVGPTGVTAQANSTFKTLTPVFPVTATVFPTSGMTVGVGQPIVVHFDQFIETQSSKTSVIPHFTITESKPVPGGWHWFSYDELHFRPESFWPAGERITVTGNLAGWNAGSGEWGSGTISDTFTIGAARISYANLASDRMTVTLNGAVVASYPISGGRPQYPTMDGDHIVLDKEPVVHMVSSTVGIPVNSPNGYDEYVYNDVHISDSGEYVHAAPWSVASQGVTNVSHGCINLSVANSSSFYDFSSIGDVVEVTGSPRPAQFGDHGVMDWSTPWSEWTPGKVVAASTPPASTSTTSTTVAGSASSTSPTTSVPATRPTSTTTH